MDTGVRLRQLASAETIAVNAAKSTPTGLLSAADTFTVDSQTTVLGNTRLSPGDLVAGGLIGTSGESASSVEAASPRVLVDVSPTGSATGRKQGGKP